MITSMTFILPAATGDSDTDMDEALRRVRQGQSAGAADEACPLCGRWLCKGNC